MHTFRFALVGIRVLFDRLSERPRCINRHGSRTVLQRLDSFGHFMGVDLFAWSLLIIGVLLFLAIPLHFWPDGELKTQSDGKRAKNYDWKQFLVVLMFSATFFVYGLDRLLEARRVEERKQSETLRQELATFEYNSGLGLNDNTFDYPQKSLPSRSSHQRLAYPQKSLSSQERFAFIRENCPPCLSIHYDSINDPIKQSVTNTARESEMVRMLEQTRLDYSAMQLRYVLKDKDILLIYESGHKGDRISFWKMDVLLLGGAILKVNVDQVSTILEAQETLKGQFSPDLWLIKSMSKGTEVSLFLTHDFINGQPHAIDANNSRHQPLILTQEQKSDLEKVYDFIRSVRELGR
jgi:hypothetical protein